METDDIFMKLQKIEAYNALNKERKQFFKSKKAAKELMEKYRKALKNYQKRVIKLELELDTIKLENNELKKEIQVLRSK